MAKLIHAMLHETVPLSVTINVEWLDKLGCRIVIKDSRLGGKEQVLTLGIEEAAELARLVLLPASLTLAALGKQLELFNE